jgi:hypothetical protein
MRPWKLTFVRSLAATVLMIADQGNGIVRQAFAACNAHDREWRLLRLAAKDFTVANT